MRFSLAGFIIYLDDRVGKGNHQEPKDYPLFCDDEFDIIHGVQENECS